MNILDLIIVVLLLSAVARGVRAGLMQLLLSSAGFVAGLLLGSQVATWIAPHASGPLMKLFIVLIVEFGLAAFLASMGESAGLYLNKLARRLHPGRLNQALGAGLALIFTLVVVWLGASALTNVRSYDIGGQV